MSCSTRSQERAKWTVALRLYDDLIALNEGRVDAYKRTRGMVVDWLKAYPLKTNRWGPFFEEVTIIR